MPTVISVIIFIIWYMISTSSMKMAREGSINMVVGMWISTFVIAPFSVFITYKANLDSVVFNLEAYKNLFCRLLGIRTKRHLMRKEVIINEPRMDVIPQSIDELRRECLAYNEQKQLRRAPNYGKTFFHYQPDAEVEAINHQMEMLIEELSNSRNTKILGVLNEFPILYVTAHTSPFHNAKYNMAAGVFFPIGCVLWFRIWRFRLRLYRDLRIIVRTCNRLDQVITGTEDATETSGAEADALTVQQNHKKEVARVEMVGSNCCGSAVGIRVVERLSTLPIQKSRAAKRATTQTSRTGRSAHRAANAHIAGCCPDVSK